MKKFYLSALMGFCFLGLYSQHVIVPFSQTKPLQETSFDELYSGTAQDKEKSDFLRWYNYGAAMQLYHGMASTVNADFLFPDTTIGGLVGYAGIKIHNVAEVLDVTSVMYNNNNLYPNALILDGLSRFYLDSVAFHCTYQRNLYDTAIVDTLVFEISINANLGTVFFAPSTPVPINLSTDTVYLKNLPYTYQSNTLNLPGKFVYKVPLTYQDYVNALPNGDMTVKIATSSLPEVMPGRYAVAAVSFIPGYTWTPYVDNINTKNNIKFKSRKQLYNQFPYYVKRDFNVSYTIPTDVRYNFAGGWNGLYIPAYAYMGGTVATYPYEHHLIDFLVRSRFKISADYPSSFPCHGQSDGYINLNVAGGVPPYSFVWNNGATMQNLQNLSAGTYRVTITDADSTFAIRSYKIAQPPSAIQANVSTNPTTSCGASDGAIIFSNMQGGTPPYSVIILDSDSLTQTPTNLPAGIYTVKVIDANACIYKTYVAINETGSATLNTQLNNISCYGITDGSIGLSLNNPPGLPSYTWSTGQTTADIQNLSAGTYNVTVSDGLCLIYSSFNITEPTPISVSGTVVNPSGGLSNGMIVLNVSGGTPNYTYLWSTGQSTKNISNLGSGTYTVTVTDTKACSEMESFTLISTGLTNHSYNVHVSTYPNPVNSFLTLEIEGLQTNCLAEYTVYNIHGGIVKNEMKPLCSATSHILIDFSQVSAGFYLIDVKIDNMRFLRKIIK